MGQGRKRAYLGGEVYRHDPANYLVLAVPLPAECDAETGPGKPILMVNIDVDATMVGEMLLEIDDPSAPPGGRLGASPRRHDCGAGRGGRPAPQCLRCPVDSRLLGRQMVREVVYRVLRGEQGGALRWSGKPRRSLHADLSGPPGTSIRSTQAARRGRAGEAGGTSASVFHHHFKLVTACSPLQYIKRIRLDRARALMTLDGYNAGSAARAVGYESASQFGREFKRLFGVTPVEAAEQTRARLVAAVIPPRNVPRWSPGAAPLSCTTTALPARRP